MMLLLLTFGQVWIAQQVGKTVTAGMYEAKPQAEMKSGWAGGAFAVAGTNLTHPRVMVGDHE